MTWRSALVGSLLGVLAVLVQTSILARLDLPGPVPALGLVVVLAVALAAGPDVGAVAGFSTGLALAFIPTDGGTLGLAAALFALAGFLVGSLRVGPQLSVPQAAAAVAAIVLVATMLALALSTMLATGAMASGLSELFIQAGYAFVLALAAIPVAAVVLRPSLEHA